MTAEAPPFERTSREELEGDADSFDWTALSDEVDGLSDIVSDLQLGSGARAPTIEDRNYFKPHGWVGTFAGDVQVLPVDPDSEKAEYIDREMYDEFVAGAQRVAGTYGLRSATATLSLLPQAVREMRTTYLWYSRRLIQLTERLYESRLPVQVERETHVGYEFRGQPDIERTITEQARGTGRVVSREISFSVVTPVTRLLAVFHRELGNRLSLLTRELGLEDDLVTRRVTYHESTRRDRLPKEVVDAAPSANLPTPSDLDEMRSSHVEAVRDLAQVWKGYQRMQPPEMRWQDRFDTAIKPIQRVYELWCLEQILDILTRAFGTDGLTSSGGSGIPTRYDFSEAGISLFYDRSVRSIDDERASRYAGPSFRQSGGEVGKPDFLISENRRPRWVADAKFQLAHDIDTSGLYRFFGYVVDFLASEDGRAALLCAAGEPIASNTEIEGRPTQVIATNDNQAHTRQSIAEDIDAALSSEIEDRVSDSGD